MSTASDRDAERLERLSALVDGEISPDDAAAACACWRDDREARASWHVYHLIGDVLRSDDLAAEPARDVALLAAVRSRLAGEAVVLAPAQHLRRRPDAEEKRRTPSDRTDIRASRFPWVVSSAVAAGFVAAAGTFMMMRAPEPVANSPVALASAARPSATDASPAAALPHAVVPSESASVRPGGFVAAGVVRDPRLDAYLAAHKQFAGTSALGVPSAFMRSAAVETSGR